MTEYRKELPPIEEGKYWHVDFGPIPGKPDWHEQSKPTSYAFPTDVAALQFADAHKRLEPDRYVAVRHPQGHIQEITLGASYVERFQTKTA
jgi:hypothetical protein